MTKEEFLERFGKEEPYWFPSWHRDTYECVFAVYVGKPGEPLKNWRRIHARLKATPEQLKLLKAGDEEASRQFSSKLEGYKREAFEVLCQEYPEGIEEVVMMNTLYLDRVTENGNGDLPFVPKWEHDGGGQDA